MRTVLFQDVLFYVASLCFGTADDLQQQHATSLIRYINKELATAWEEYPWPELVKTEQRWYRPFWIASPGNYAQGSEVYDPATDQYWLASSACTAADVPGTSTKWVPDAPMDFYVGYSQPGYSPLGEIAQVWNNNPRVFPSAVAVEYWLSDNGVQMVGWGNCGQPPLTSVWIDYRLQPSQFTGVQWSAGSYAQGARVYYTDGNCYLSLVGTNTATPGTDATKWQVIPFPYVLAKYVQQAAYAEWLKEDGQNDKAQRERAEAEALLTRAMSQLVIQGQSTHYSVRGDGQLRPQTMLLPP